MTNFSSLNSNFMLISFPTNGCQHLKKDGFLRFFWDFFNLKKVVPTYVLIIQCLTWCLVDMLWVACMWWNMLCHVQFLHLHIYLVSTLDRPRVISQYNMIHVCICEKMEFEISHLCNICGSERSLIKTLVTAYRNMAIKSCTI